MTEKPNLAVTRNSFLPRLQSSDWLLALLVSAVLVICFGLFQRRSFDPDEFEHAHAAWLVSKGQVPYRDFFEHHTPWLYYVTAPLLKLRDPASSAASACESLLNLRVFSLVASGIGLLLLARIGMEWIDRRTGLTATLFALCTPLFSRKALEFRPDAIALTMYLASLWLLLRAVHTPKTSARDTARCLLASGICIGIALMFTQKMLFVLPGLFSSLIAWSLLQKNVIPKFRVLFGAMFLVGVALPGVATWAVFACEGLGFSFIYNNFLLNAGWKVRISPTERLARFFFDSWPILLLALNEGVMTVIRFCEKSVDWTAIIILSTALGLVAGLWVIPVAQDQYFLMFVPLFSLLAAKNLTGLIRTLSDKMQPRIFLIFILVIPSLAMPHLTAEWKRTNAPQLAQLTFVMKNTAPEDVVMDGWRGLGVFRPHAFHYYFLHPEIRAMVPQGVLNRFLQGLESGNIRPKVIILDNNLRQLPKRFTRFVNENYDWNRGYDILVRKKEVSRQDLLPQR